MILHILLELALNSPDTDKRKIRELYTKQPCDGRPALSGRRRHMAKAVGTIMAALLLFAAMACGETTASEACTERAVQANLVQQVWLDSRAPVHNDAKTLTEKSAEAKYGMPYWDEVRPQGSASRYSIYSTWAMSIASGKLTKWEYGCAYDADKHRVVEVDRSPTFDVLGQLIDKYPLQ